LASLFLVAESAKRGLASLGLRAFSGISVGLLGSLVGVHRSLGLSALATLAVAAGLLALP